MKLPVFKVAEIVKRRRKPPKCKTSLTSKQWKRYHEIIEKQLRGEKTTEKEDRLQAKGDWEVNRSLP